MAIKLKEGLINLVSVYSFIAPIFVILYLEEWKKFAAVFAVLLAAALLVPPVGWMRPHKYSELAWNRKE